MKRLGVIGGMSWESTAIYYRYLNQQIKAAKGPLSSAPLLLWNMDFAPLAQLQAEGEWDELTELMCAAARGLKAGGAEALIIATNTMHLMADEVQQAADLPLVHIADATAGAIRGAGVRKPLLLATRFTMEKEFYRHRVEHGANCAVAVPEEPHRTSIHNVIYKELVLGEVKATSRETYLNIIGYYQREHGIDGVIFGCTEVGMLIHQSMIDVPCFDTSAIHCEAAAAAILGH